jgi:hypothetical protein
MPETNGVALGQGAPSIVQMEPMSSEPPEAPVAACVDPSAGGSGGAGGAGSGAEELVRRFGGSEGAGPTADPQPLPEGGPACDGDALGAIGSCGSAIRQGASKGPWGIVYGALSCVSALDDYLKCLANEKDAEKAGEKP